jgi:hypothetical protein
MQHRASADTLALTTGIASSVSKQTPGTVITSLCELLLSASACEMPRNSAWQTPNWCNIASGLCSGRYSGWNVDKH